MGPGIRISDRGEEAEDRFLSLSLSLECVCVLCVTVGGHGELGAAEKNGTRGLSPPTESAYSRLYCGCAEGT